MAALKFQFHRRTASRLLFCWVAFVAIASFGYAQGRTPTVRQNGRSSRPVCPPVNNAAPEAPSELDRANEVARRILLADSGGGVSTGRGGDAVVCFDTEEHAKAALEPPPQKRLKPEFRRFIKSVRLADHWEKELDRGSYNRGTDLPYYDPGFTRGRFDNSGSDRILTHQLNFHPFLQSALQRETLSMQTLLANENWAEMPGLPDINDSGRMQRNRPGMLGIQITETPESDPKCRLVQLAIRIPIEGVPPRVGLIIDQDLLQHLSSNEDPSGRSFIPGDLGVAMFGLHEAVYAWAERLGARSSERVREFNRRIMSLQFFDTVFLGQAIYPSALQIIIETELRSVDPGLYGQLLNDRRVPGAPVGTSASRINSYGDLLGSAGYQRIISDALAQEGRSAGFAPADWQNTSLMDRLNQRIVRELGKNLSNLTDEQAFLIAARTPASGYVERNPGEYGEKTLKTLDSLLLAESAPGGANGREISLFCESIQIRSRRLPQNSETQPEIAILRKAVNYCQTVKPQEHTR